MGAEVGFVFLWGVIVASVVKYFIQVELGRQCLLNDETTIQSLGPGQGIQGAQHFLERPGCASPASSGS